MINFILLILAIILFSVLAPIGFIYAMLFKGRKEYFLQVAIAIDQHGNTICGKLFTVLLLKKDGFGFGNVDRTISFVIGINKAAGTLNRKGVFIYNLLNRIEPNHCEKAIESEIKNII